MTEQAPPYLIEPQPEADEHLTTAIKYVPGETVIRYKIPTHTYLRIKLYARTHYLRMGVATARLLAQGLDQLNVTRDPAVLIGLARPPKLYFPPAGKPDNPDPQGT